MTFVKTTKGKVFGGYADMSWDSRGKSTIGKGESYLFGFKDDLNLVKCKCINVSVEMVCSKDHLVAFGQGRDLIIKANSNKNKESYSSLGSNYEIQDFEDDSLAGERNF